MEENGQTVNGNNVEIKPVFLSTKLIHIYFSLTELSRHQFHYYAGATHRTAREKTRYATMHQATP